jgi:hypothetical protein
VEVVNVVIVMVPIIAGIVKALLYAIGVTVQERDFLVAVVIVMALVNVENAIIQVNVVHHQPVL